MDVVVEAIITSDKSDLLKRFISEYDENGTIGFFLLKASPARLTGVALRIEPFSAFYIGIILLFGRVGVNLRI